MKTTPHTCRVANQGPTSGMPPTEWPANDTNHPPRINDNPAPIDAPDVRMLMGKERFSGWNRSASSETAAGTSAASPMPTHMRAAKSPPKVVANPEAIVAALQRKMPAAINRSRWTRSARAPKGIPRSA